MSKLGSEGLGRGFWVSWVVAMAWSLWRLLMNEAWILDDEIAHFMTSQDVWSDPDELWHPWSRPGRNLLQFLPAYFGLTAARVWTLGLAGMAIWLTGREARRLKMPLLWALPLLIGFQCWFPELSYPVLTQTPFMVVWIAGVFFASRNQLVLSALCWGYLPLVRHEGIALSGLFGLWVIFGPGGFARYLLKGKWKEAGGAFPRAATLGFFTFLPLIVMNVASGLTRGEWPFLLFFDSEPTDYYGSGPIWLYTRHLVVGAGVPVILLMVYGAFRPISGFRWKDLLWGTYPVYLIMHSIIYWKGLFASGGYYHFIMPMAPFVGVLALRGLAGVRDRFGEKALWGSLVAVVWMGLLMPQQQGGISDGHIPGLPEIGKERYLIAPPIKQSRFGRGVAQAAKWVRENGVGKDVLTHHVAASYWLRGAEIGEKLGAWEGYEPESKELEAGTILIWDAQYSVQEQFGFSRERLRKAGWVERAAFAYGSVRVFEKT